MRPTHGGLDKAVGPFDSPRDHMQETAIDRTHINTVFSPLSFLLAFLHFLGYSIHMYYASLFLLTWHRRRDQENKGWLGEHS